MKIKVNPNNPRIIKDENFQKLVQSIKDFPEMLDIRPIVVNKEGIILGGNMRYKACLEAGIKNPPFKIVDLTQEQQNEFLIKDNISGGEWNWEILANEWDADKLDNWDLKIPNFDKNVNLDDFFEENNSEEKLDKFKIILEYTEEEFNMVQEAFNKLSGSKESIVFNFLGL